MKSVVVLVCISLCALVCSPSASHAQWIDTGGPAAGTPLALVVSGTNLFAATQNGSVYLSSDDGGSWTRVSSGLTGAQAISLAANGSSLFVGTWALGVFRSTNGGGSWTAVNAGLWDHYVLSLAASGGSVLAGTDGDGVFRTTDNGTTWFQTNLKSWHIPALALSGPYVFAGSDGGGIYRSSDNGATWTAVNSGLTSLSVYALAATSTTLFAGTAAGVFATHDNGASWTAATTGVTNYAFTSLLAIGPRVLASVHNYGGVFLTTDDGAHWATSDSGLGLQSVWCLAANDRYIFAGNDYTVWRRPLTDVAAVEQTSARVPMRCAVYQNAPNPFRRNTTITFALPRAMHVTLDVYSMLGERAASVVSEDLPAGTYETNWNASGVAPGVYLYRLRAGSYTETRKLLLLR